MADVKREVRALGQKITGLKAGDNVTLVFKKPKPRVDATLAKRAVEISEEAINSARDMIRALQNAKGLASDFKIPEAQKLLDQARKVSDKLFGEMSRAKDWVESAKADADAALAEVKDGYNAAKDAADVASGQLKNIAEGAEKAIGSVFALAQEFGSR
jgi:hypothetical protein